MQIATIRYNQTIEIIKYIKTAEFFNLRAPIPVVTLIIKGMLDNAHHRLAISSLYLEYQTLSILIHSFWVFMFMQYFKGRANPCAKSSITYVIIPSHDLCNKSTILVRQYQLDNTLSQSNSQALIGRVSYNKMRISCSSCCTPLCALKILSVLIRNNTKDIR